MKAYITKEEINRRFVERGKPHIKALSGSYGFEDTISFNCSKHNYTWKGQIKSVLYKKYSCQLCCNEGRVNGVYSKHDLWKEAPEVAKLLENPEDAKGLSRSSKKKRWFICPNCHSRLYKSITVVSNFGLSCNKCSDGYSYPNKIMYNLLTQLAVDFIPEYSPAWISPRRYDFYFKLNGKKYIVEMDGGLGHGHKTFSYKENPLTTLERDLSKDETAKKHHITVIRIDCTTSNINYIRGKLEGSSLKDILPLQQVDWDEIDNLSKKSLVKEVADYYKKYPFYSYKDLGVQFGLSEDTLRKYIKIGHQLGLCPAYTNSNSKYILCVESQIIFANAKLCGDYYGYDSSSVSKVCKGKRQSLGQLHFIYLSDYTGNIDDLIPNPSIKATSLDARRSINIYDANNVFIEQHLSKASIAKKYLISEDTIAKKCGNTTIPYKGMIFYYASDPCQPDKNRIIKQ